MTDKKICPECGVENPKEAEFCQECHAPLTDAASPGFIDPHTGHDDLDLLNEAEDDLPGLLHALKQEEEEQNNSPDEETQEGDLSSDEPEDLFELDESPVDEDVPDWLNRIRQRASEEDDSIGEITQKISAARQSLAEDGSSSQRENFDAWIQKLRGQVGRIPAEEVGADALDEQETQNQEAQGEKEPEWLIKIRKAQGKTDSQTEHAGNGTLNWLDTLQVSEKETPGDQDESEGVELETSDKDADHVELDSSRITKEIILDEAASAIPIPPKLTVTGDEQAQAEAFTSMILDEKAPRPVRKLKGPLKLDAARFFFAILLIVSLSLSLYIDKINGVQSPPMQPTTAGLINWVNSLPNGASILLIFDYQPAWAGEIKLMAAPLLEALIERKADFTLISSSLSGSVLANQLFEDISSMDDLTLTDLGYFPMGVFGAFRLGMETAGNWQINGVPESAKKIPTEDFEGILLFSDSYQGARSWIEQLSILMPETPVNLVVTSGTAPMLAPYFDSEQIMGMTFGLYDATILEAKFSDSNVIAIRWGAYRVGLLILMSVMVIGAIYAGNQNREEGGAA